MATHGQLKSGFTLGEWIIKPELGQIEKAGASFHIEPKLVEVLLYLATHQGQVVERESLLDHAWRNQVVGDEALTRTISELRTLLGDSGRERRYIRTIPKRGYSLVADVSLLETKPNISAVKTPNNQFVENKAGAISLGFFSRESFSRLLRYWLLGMGSLSTATLGLLLALIVFSKDVQMNVIRDGEVSSNFVAAASRSSSENDLNTAIKNFKNLAVISFSNLTPNEDLGFFTQGLEEDIRTVLNSLPNVNVAGRLSSSQMNRAYKSDLHQGIIGLAKSLDVDAIVDGTVRLINGKLRITVQLLDGKTGFPLWSKRYDKNFDDVLSLQASIANDIHCELDSRRNEKRMLAGGSMLADGSLLVEDSLLTEGSRNSNTISSANTTTVETNQTLKRKTSARTPIYGHTRHMEWLAE